MLVAAAIWAYHQRTAQEEAAQVEVRQLSARRVHAYLMSFISLGTLIAGLIVLFGIPLELATNALGGPAVLVTDWWRDQLSLCLALLLVGTPLWLYYWKQVLEMVARGGLGERKARSRRVFLYVVLGAAVITLAADLVNIVYQLLNGLLLGWGGADILRASRWSLQTLLVAAPMLFYFWRTLRADQRLGAEAVAVQKTVTVLAAEDASDIISRLEARLGYRFKRLHYLGPAAEIPVVSEEALSQLANDVQAAPGTSVMLVVSQGNITVLPYQEK